LLLASDHDFLREEPLAILCLEKGKLDAGDTDALGVEKRRDLFDLWSDPLAHNHDALVFVEGDGLVGRKVERLSMILGEGEGVVVLVGLEDLLQLVRVQAACE
jgi:hypothetical protein